MENLIIYDLVPRYSNQKSFYGKAKIAVDSKCISLYSYDTKVAYIDCETNKAYMLGNYSHTTLKHQKEFFKQYNFKADNLKQMLKDYQPCEQ